MNGRSPNVGLGFVREKPSITSGSPRSETNREKKGRTRQRQRRGRKRERNREKEGLVKNGEDGEYQVEGM